ncbi:DUF2922 domain-containing protein [Proteiniclasticum ruminis]|jgi:hypothetical protein|uniref:DUF2922 domain-containing protein n=1 Tax=Proteiniclasticum ruminis TaxID=398199 RepID=A0A1G8IKF9_9CLOT|nr:DUF2922 domain-containing protein [Proteiniclasticum ruminis]MBP9920964.1 DUF2922 domain-containing protein [Proteiniclasticum sp.]SDI19518.1 Protein of unknown function [Proteiniclasticum ruminis]
MNTLTMTFLTKEGKKWNLRLPKVREDILDEEVEALMSAIISKNVLFEGEKELVEIESASINREEELIA